MKLFEKNIRGETLKFKCFTSVLNILYIRSLADCEVRSSRRFLDKGQYDGLFIGGLVASWCT